MNNFKKTYEIIKCIDCQNYSERKCIITNKYISEAMANFKQFHCENFGLNEKNVIKYSSNLNERKNDNV